MDLIHKYFDDLTDEQNRQFAMLGELYKEWNNKINVISRKDIDNLYERHVLHSLALACPFPLADGSRVLDVGTGGGFPGIPLAIFYPQVEFHLIDGTGKKIKVVQEVADALGLKNVRAQQIRAENLKKKYDFVVSRAVTRLPAFVEWVANNIDQNQKNPWPNGILYLKGGDLEEELSELKYDYEVIPISTFFEEEFFETKKIVYVRML